MIQYTEDSIRELVEKQRAFFNTGATLDTKWRLKQLRALKEALKSHEEDLLKALREDLCKSSGEAMMCDIMPVYIEINDALAHLRRWSRPERRFSGLMCFPSTRTTVYKMPYGVTLIISPFNFPVYLTLGVLVASIAGGNTAILKTSSKSTATSDALYRMISETFPPEYITLVEGGHDVADMCLKQRFDKIFYTGSPKVAKHIMAEASANLTPVALELGGETGNWCIVRKDSDLFDAARKIAFFKLCNAGQICININQIAVASEVAEPFLKALKEEFIRQIGNDPLSNPDYPKLISASAYDKCSSLAEKYSERIIFGGKGDESSRKFEPTIIYPVNIEEEIVNKELFCPLLPIVTFEDNEVDKLLETIASREHPLAMYIFTRDTQWAKKVMRSSQYGGGCINEVCVHIMVKGAPFNGAGHSGMGAYHGEWGFREFTHPSTVLSGRRHFNLSLREHPYTDLKLKIFRSRFLQRK